MSLEEIRPIDLEDIRISKDNVRLSDPQKDLGELAASIKKHGLLQPVVLLGEYGHPPYHLITGQRRFLAHKLLKEKTIRAVFAGPLTRTQAVVRSLVENLQRVDLDYQDTAKAITELYESLGRDERKVEKETGLSLRKVREYVLIQAKATPKMKQLLKARKVSPADVKRALRAAQDNLKKAEELLDLIIDLRPTSHQKRRIVEYAERDTAASAREIITEAMKPHVEENIIITLPDDVREALKIATTKLAMEPEELASKILSDWLRAQGFAK
jgi:ParB family chromosome partitioning protein